MQHKGGVPWLPAATCRSMVPPAPYVSRSVSSLSQRGHVVGLRTRIGSEQICNQQCFVTGVPDRLALTSGRLHGDSVAGTAGALPAWAAAGVIGLRITPRCQTGLSQSRLLLILSCGEG